MKKFDIPKVTIREEDGNKGIFFCSKLERGFGTTIGNALRRVLLSSLPSYRIYSAKIEGVEHEFSTIEGVTEDVVALILAFKQVQIRALSKDILARENVFRLDVKNDGDEPLYVTNASIRTTSDFEIVNTDKVLCTIQPGFGIKAELYIKEGRGYVSSDRNAGTERVAHRIYIDTLHSPVEVVNYHVDTNQVEGENLSIEVTTNGSVTPKDAIAQAAKILYEFFKSFEDISPEAYNREVISDTLENAKVDFSNQENIEIEGQHIDTLNLSKRNKNALTRVGIKYVEQLITKTESEIKSTPSIGKKCIDEIVEALAQKGLSLAKESRGGK